MTDGFTSMDAIIRRELRSWPQHPPGLIDHDMGASSAWIRARPGSIHDPDQPHLKLPGANKLKTHPDGLWFCFGGDVGDPFVDIFAIEACGSYQNLLDKRSRFAPSLHSMLAVCSPEWLAQPVSTTNQMQRWRYTGVLHHQPTGPVALPVRDVRVLYVLRPRHYAGFAASQIPHAHEFFAPVAAIIGPDGWHHPHLRAFIARTSPKANFFDYPGTSAA